MLNVYRASAGSGKTYKLAFEYIKILLGHLNGDDNKYIFYKNYNNLHRRILAVTFTNKATEEMKQRIVKQLEVLAYNTSQSDYCKDLCQTFGCDVATLQTNARQVLVQLLHDFSYFNITTIDSFFQQVLRAFAREEGLHGGYDVEMDATYITETAIDQMFSELEGNEDMSDWLLRYAEESIRNNGSWNIYGSSEIQNMAKQLTSENYKQYRKELSQVTFKEYGEYFAILNEHRAHLCQCLSAEAVNVANAIQDHNISLEWFNRGWIKCVDVIKSASNDNISYDSLKKALDTFIKNYSEPDKWFAKTKLPKGGGSVDTYVGIVQPSFDALALAIDHIMVELNSIPVCLKHIYVLGLLATIDEYILRYERENNTLLLSKTPEILSGLINKSDTPFIYERIGTRIAHYMIDEFQDTSNLQWHNFQPLVNESLDNNYENFIVGDVKQSIYRWRNSDWRLLHSGLESYEYNRINKGRDTNWRSCGGIVAFNNTFFKKAAWELQSMLDAELPANNILPKHSLLREIYDGVEQKVADKYKDYSGRVALHLLPSKTVKDFEEDVMRRLPGEIKSLLERGYRQKDIAILTRKNAQSSKIVEMLLDIPTEGQGVLSDIRVISDESLLVTNSPAVKLIVAILRYLQNPHYPINRLVLAYEQAMMNAGDVVSPSEALARYFDNSTDNRAFSEEMLSFMEGIAAKPLYEMCEAIIEKFNMHKNASNIAYIEAFQDIVLEYTRAHSADLHSFLRWWDDKEKTATVKSPENLDAITIVSIHKSKGLEYPVVLIPFASWSLSSAGQKPVSTMWLVPDRAPFNQLPVLPVEYKKDLATTIFAPQYFEEMTNEYVDNINLAYVAFTRARQELIVYTNVAGNDAKNMGGMIKRVMENTPAGGDDESHVAFDSYRKELETGEVVYELGADWQPLVEKESCTNSLDTSYNVFIPSNDRLRQRMSSRGKTGNRKQALGILMHELFAEIDSVADVHNVVQRYVRCGKIKNNEAAKIEQKVTDLISADNVARWFSPEVRVITETAILQKGEKCHRPDRVVIDGDAVVVIDYKFGSIESEEYTTQVQKYMSLVRGMGYNEVEGYIWYVTKNKIVSVV